MRKMLMAVILLFTLAAGGSSLNVKAAAIMDLVKNEVALAGQYGKPLTVGVETEQSSEGDNVSFYEEGEAYMDQELASVTGYFGASSGFGGIAIHHVGSWMTMKP